MESKNGILWIHARWLHDNGYYKEFMECVEQATSYDPHKDVRQIRFGKKYEMEQEVYLPKEQ